MLVGTMDHRTGLIDLRPRRERIRMARQWRVTGTFVGGLEIAVIVSAPNWVGGLRKGALEIKRSEVMKGRRLRGGLFSISEITDTAPNPNPRTNASQLPLSPSVAAGEAVTQSQGVEAEVTEIESESEVPPEVALPGGEEHQE